MDLRKAICAKLKNENALEFTPDQIVVSNGAKQSICNAILSLIDPEDEVIIPAPYWVSYVEMVKLAEGKSVIITAGNSAIGRPLSYYNSMSDRVWVYTSPSNANLTVYPKADNYIKLVANIGGIARDDYFKFPDGYAPEEIMRCGDGSIIYDAAIKPELDSISGVPIDFPYTDVKNIVDDMCTAWHWRKIYRNGTLHIEPIVSPELRDGAPDAWAHIHDWSDKLRSIETADVPDEFADQYICTIGDAQFSYSNGPGTVTPVKDAYKSGVAFSYNDRKFPIMGLTGAFTRPSTYDKYYTYVKHIYYPYIERHFKMFRSRIQVKIKAQLEYKDVENLRLGDAYYFSQLNSYFYIKSLGGFDVSRRTGWQKV